MKIDSSLKMYNDENGLPEKYLLRKAFENEGVDYMRSIMET